jgi:NhaB family Na+:H+ antiporter|tara:strand:- start:7024 stop:8478 length:1455 start_codon:yes stop_codon:yes gene_type:complete
VLNTIFKSFLGSAPVWYKTSIISFLALNPILFFIAGPESSFILGWIILLQFIFTLVFSLQCYPLQPGGLIAFQALLLGLTSPEHVLYEIKTNLEVILLLVFMVSAIFFMKNLLMVIFTKLLQAIKSKTLLSLLFVISAAFLSAFLDALTVTAVLITVTIGFYRVFEKSYKTNEIDKQEFEQSKSFLADIMMHGAVGTALGGVCTIVGEPQNLLIAEKAGWEFMEFFYQMAPVTMPVLVAGLVCCVLVEKFKVFNYGFELTDTLRNKIILEANKADAERTDLDKAHLVIEAILGICLILALGFHLAPVGIIGLFLMVFLTAFKGITEEHQLGGAFKESLPFTALLVIFFVVVAVISDQKLFTPVIELVLATSEDVQVPLFYLANGALSAISDNVFVATVYMNEIVSSLANEAITPEQFDRLAIAINTGTNLPSVATPNGQAAFLFLLTSSLAPLIGLSYMRMVYKALPYTIVLTLVGLACVIFYI